MADFLRMMLSLHLSKEVGNSQMNLDRDRQGLSHWAMHGPTSPKQQLEDLVLYHTGPELTRQPGQHSIVSEINSDLNQTDRDTRSHVCALF
ncbi:hypothetical protein NL676_004722 [Syzygium grande]|nr:hypothetical protein NL676_004722 [Syzygium grande]